MTTASDDTGRLFATIHNWRAAGHDVAIATVIETWGSAPRQKGAHLAIRDDGLFEGSVSGGCIEGDVITTAIETLASRKTVRRDYGVADEKAWDVGLACGGKISVLVQPVAEHGFAPALIDRIITASQDGETVWTVTDLARGETHEKTPDRAENPDAFLLAYAPPFRLMIVGAVHISQALVPLAKLMGFAPLIVDPRTSFAAAQRFNDIDVDTRWPDEALEDWKPNAASAVVTLTHDPKLDDPALQIALQSPAFYIAALGSRRTHSARRERLQAAGFDEMDINRIHGPAGLEIGAASPPEIALSIMAELIAARRTK